MKSHRPRLTLQPRTAALTRIEVLAVVAGVGLLAVLALPALARGDDKSRTLRCLENLRRLTLGWTLFASDHDNRLVPIRHGADAFYPGSVKPGEQGWAFGWLDWSTAPANTNLSYLVDERYSAIAVYLARDPSLFRCPDDDSLSPVQRRGKWTWRARSYSANVAVGRGNAETGPWDRTFLHVERMSDLLIPGAAETIVFMEEHADSINDAAFFPPTRTCSWTSPPATMGGRAPSPLRTGTSGSDAGPVPGRCSRSGSSPPAERRCLRAIPTSPGCAQGSPAEPPDSSAAGSLRARPDHPGNGGWGVPLRRNPGASSDFGGGLG